LDALSIGEADLVGDVAGFCEPSSAGPGSGIDDLERGPQALAPSTATISTPDRSGLVGRARGGSLPRPIGLEPASWKSMISFLPSGVMPMATSRDVEWRPRHSFWPGPRRRTPGPGSDSPADVDGTRTPPDRGCGPRGSPSSGDHLAHQVLEHRADFRVESPG